MNTKAQPYDFTRKTAHYHTRTTDELRYALKDAVAAREASRGWNPEAECWYADDVATIAAVLKGRERQQALAAKRGCPVLAH